MQRKRQLLQLIIFAVDVVMVTVAYVLAYGIRFYYLPDGIVGGDYFMLYMVVLVLYALVFYMGSEKWRGLSPSWIEDLAALLQNHIYMGLFLFAFLFVMKSGTEYSRLQIFLFLVLSFLFSYIIRRCVRKELARRLKSSDAVEKIVLVSTADNVEDLLAKLEKRESWYYKVIGICLLDKDWKGKNIQGIRVLANHEDMLAVLAKESLDSVLIGGREMSGANVETLVEGLCSMGITTHVQIQRAQAFKGEQQYDEFGDMAVMSYMTLNSDLKTRLLSRVADILVGMLGTLLYVVCYFVIAVIIKLTSEGPVTISYTRVGRNGRRFHVHLFRTKSIPGAGRTMRLGRFLEWSGIQCMPLFFHLITGDLTLTGEAAPSLPEFMSYTPGQRQRMCKKPGLIGTWVRGGFDDCEQEGQLVLWKEERENLFAAWREQPDFGDMPMRLQVYHGIKRMFDVVFSCLALIICSPIWILIALAIYFNDGHNPLYTQVRVGKHGRKISIYKFRSMYYQSDDLERLLTPEQLIQYKKEFKITDDPRVTPIGRFLRRSSLDELPQLLNILKGDISFIGPRPIVAKETEVYGGDIVKLLCVKPGLTGYWQAYARNHATYETGERQKMELYYADHEHFWLDIRILLKTIGRVLTGDGAY